MIDVGAVTRTGRVQTQQTQQQPQTPVSDQPVPPARKDPNLATRVIPLIARRIPLYGGQSGADSLSSADSEFAWSKDGTRLFVRHKTTGDEIDLPAASVMLVFTKRGDV